MSEDKRSLKDLVSGELGKDNQVDPEIQRKIDEIKDQFIAIIPDLANEHNNEVPFEAIHAKTGYDYNLISDIILNLIMEKKLIGFINDSGTEALSDDILIIKKERYLDSLEIDYETG